MTTCAIYIRKSREEAGKPSHRLTVQREQLPAHARAQGWHVSIYDDGHASAARGKTEDLRERARLETDIRARRVQIVLCIELSRLSRDDSLQDYVAWLHLCSQHHVKLATPSRILDPGQHSDWMLLLMEGGFSSVEMRVLQARMRQGRAQAHQEGKYLSGNPPIPYRYDRAIGGLIIDPQQLPRFERMMHLAQTLPALQVAQKTGLPTITVRRAIADDRLLMYQGLRLGENETPIIGQWPPVLTAEQAARIRAARINRVSGYNRRTSASLLTNLGLLMCGYCGRSIRAWAGRTRKDGTRQAYYGCTAKEGRDCPPSRMIDQGLIDQAIITHLLDTLAQTAQLQHYWHINQNHGDHADKLKTIEHTITTLTQKKQRLVAAIAEGIIDFTDAKQQRRQIESQLHDATTQRQQLTAAQASPPDWDALHITPQDWDTLTRDEQRDLIRATIAQAKLYTRHIIMDYHFPRAADGTTTARLTIPEKKRHKSKKN